MDEIDIIARVSQLPFGQLTYILPELGLAWFVFCFLGSFWLERRGLLDPRRELWSLVWVIGCFAFVVGLFVWSYIADNHYSSPGAEENLAVVDQCWEDWERFNRPEKWLWNCLDRANLRP